MNNTQRIGSSILRLTTALLLAVVTTASAQTFTLLHTFTGSDGAYPVGSLIVSNATLYGMTSSRVCKMNTNGSSCSNLHSFGGFAGNADNPHAALTLSGTNLYGMTVEGGAGVGVAFRVSTNGIGYTNVHSFAGGTNDGATAYGSLMLDGSTLYGMTYYGGATNKGVVFALSNIPPAPPPSLTIVYANKQAIVSWPSSVSGWTLQTNNNPATGTWSNYTGPIISNTVTNSPTKGNLFFRLRHP
jgi:uncharacterized repeat protein (TIGR03803 family)